MYKKTLVAALATCALALGAVGTVTPASAATHFGVYVGPTYSGPPSGPRQCWAWSRQAHDWVWTCRRQSMRHNSPTFAFSFGSGDANY
jgi:hypothetical protein